jgi:putative membrane protein
MKHIRSYFLVLMKGIAMGAADVVPGVSGGTIAFITGIYEKLLDSINGVNLGLFKIIKTKGIVAAWKSFNGSFLLALFGGIGISIFSLARVIEWLLLHEPVKLWAFFFGLVLASIIYVGKQVGKWSFGAVIGIILGAALAFTITVLPPLGSSDSLIYMFFCGMIAVCAMILPGISGSFILLILGAYQPVIEALSDRNFSLLAVVGAGCVVGLLTFSRVLKWLFRKFENVTIAVLTGFLVGSLNKIWPWKEVQKVYVSHAGEPDMHVTSLVESSVLPGKSFAVVDNSVFTANGAAEVTKTISTDPQLFAAIALMIVGFGFIFLMEFIAKKMKKDEV